jgi:hypothetical protein
MKALAECGSWASRKNSPTSQKTKDLLKRFGSGTKCENVASHPQGPPNFPDSGTRATDDEPIQAFSSKFFSRLK